jgi:hypothetical protein
MWHDQKIKGLSKIYGFKQFNYLFQIGVIMMMIIIIMSWAPCYCAIPMMMNWWIQNWRKTFDFMEIKFQLNDITCTLNWKNMGWKLMQINGEVFLLNTLLENSFSKDVDVKTHLSMLLYLGMGKQIFGYIKSFGNLIIMLPKLISMNHCH